MSRHITDKVCHLGVNATLLDKHPIVMPQVYVS